MLGRFGLVDTVLILDIYYLGSVYSFLFYFYTRVLGILLDRVNIDLEASTCLLQLAGGFFSDHLISHRSWS